MGVAPGYLASFQESLGRITLPPGGSHKNASLSMTDCHPEAMLESKGWGTKQLRASYLLMCVPKGKLGGRLLLCAFIFAAAWALETSYFVNKLLSFSDTGAVAFKKVSAFSFSSSCILIYIM